LCWTKTRPANGNSRPTGEDEDTRHVEQLSDTALAGEQYSDCVTHAGWTGWRRVCVELN